MARNRWINHSLPTLAIFLALLQFGPSLVAQSPGPDDWTFVVAPYFVLPYLDGDVAVRGRDVSVNAGPSDIFDNLQFGFMGYFEARKGKWGVGVDALYMALGVSRPLVNIDPDQGSFAFTGIRKLNDKVDLLFGARWNFVKNKLSFKGPAQLVFSDTKHWVDPMVGISVVQPLGGPWYFGVEGDIGGFGAASDFAWNVFPRVGVDVGKKVRLAFGYRATGVDYETGSGNERFRYDVISSGPAFGARFSF